MTRISSATFVGGPLGCDPCCVPQRLEIMSLTEDLEPDSPWTFAKMKQGFEVVFGPSQFSCGREFVVQILVPPLFRQSEWVGPLPMSKGQAAYADKAFGFNSSAYQGLLWKYVVEEVKSNEFLYQKMFIGSYPLFESLRLSKCISVPGTEDTHQGHTVTTLRVLYETAYSLYSGIANVIASNAWRRQMEAIGKSPQVLSRIDVQEREESLLIASLSWNEWAKRYMPQAMEYWYSSTNSDKVVKRKKGKTNAKTERRATVKKSKDTKNTEQRNARNGKGKSDKRRSSTGSKKLSSVRGKSSHKK